MAKCRIKVTGKGRPSPLNKTAVKSLAVGVGEVDMENRVLGRGVGCVWTPASTPVTCFDKLAF